MKKNVTEATIGTLLANALPALAHMPVIVGTDSMPLVLVDGQASPAAKLLQERLTALGKCLDQIPEGDLEKVYGQVEARWMYAYGSASAYFLHVVVDAPSLTAPLAVPPLRAEVTVRFELRDATVRLLRMIADARRMLLNFDPEPAWMRHLPPLREGERARDMGDAGLTLVRSSLYLLFRPDLVSRLAGQLDMWEQIFKQR